jgi:Raf kinase inhibitor-like YbhB/YbcL family protein
VPEGSKSLVLIVDDPDAPDPKAPKMTWVHRVLFNLPADSKGLPEAIAPRALPQGTGEGLNDWKRTGYGGPCPPIGRHRYLHKLYALDATLDLSGHPTKAQVEAAMKGHVLAQAEVMETYQKRAQIIAVVGATQVATDPERDNDRDLRRSYISHDYERALSMPFARAAACTSSGPSASLSERAAA